MNQKKNQEEMRAAFQSPFAEELLQWNARQMKADAARKKRLAQESSQPKKEE